MLKDIGLSAADAQREASRPFWDLGVQRDGTLKRDDKRTKKRGCLAGCCQLC